MAKKVSKTKGKAKGKRMPAMRGQRQGEGWGSPKKGWTKPEPNDTFTRGRPKPIPPTALPGTTSTRTVPPTTSSGGTRTRPGNNGLGWGVHGYGGQDNPHPTGTTPPETYGNNGNGGNRPKPKIRRRGISTRNKRR